MGRFLPAASGRCAWADPGARRLTSALRVVWDSSADLEGILAHDDAGANFDFDVVGGVVGDNGFEQVQAAGHAAVGQAGEAFLERFQAVAGDVAGLEAPDAFGIERGLQAGEPFLAAVIDRVRLTAQRGGDEAHEPVRAAAGLIEQFGGELALRPERAESGDLIGRRNLLLQALPQFGLRLPGSFRFATSQPLLEHGIQEHRSGDGFRCLAAGFHEAGELVVEGRTVGIRRLPASF